MTWCSEWMPHRKKFSKKSLQALSSQNRTWEGVWSEREEEDNPEWRGFRDGVDLHLGTIEQANTRERERERERHTHTHTQPHTHTHKKHQTTSIYKNIKNWRYVCMNMWHANLNTSWAQPNPNLTAYSHSTYIYIYIYHTSIMHENIVIIQMWCNAWTFMII